MKHSTCSHKWWKTLTGSIVGVKASIPALIGPGGRLVVVPAEKASVLGPQFVSKQCRQQFVTPLSCFPQSRCNSLAFWTPVHVNLLLDLDTYSGVDPWGCVSSISKDDGGYCCSKIKHNFSWANPLGIISGVLAVCEHNCHSQECSIPW